MSLRALIFDLDGTIAETEELHRSAFNRAFTEAGLDWEWSVARYRELLAIAGGKERLRHYMHGDRPEIPPAEVETLSIALHAAKSRLYRQLLAETPLNPRPGIRRLLAAAIRESIPCAIATTSTVPSAIAVLNNALAPEGTAWFAEIAGGDTVPAKKPAPDIYLYVLDQLGLDPRHCLAFEDSDNGLQAATRAGLTTVVTVNAYTEGQDFTAAALVLDCLGDRDRPCTVLAGSPSELPYFDLAAARTLLGD